MKTECRVGSPYVIVTLSLAEASRPTDRQTDRQLSQKSDRCNVVKCHGPPVRKAIRTIGRDIQYETGLEGLGGAAVDEFALDCVHSMCGTEEIQYEPGFHSPGG